MLFGEFKALCEQGRFDRLYPLCEDHPKWRRWAERAYQGFDYDRYLLEENIRRCEAQRDRLRWGRSRGNGPYASTTAPMMALPLRNRRDYTSVARKTVFFDEP